MMKKELSLREFLLDDYNLIKQEINNSKAIMQWAGQKYKYPLSWEQMNMQMQERDEEGKKKNWLFTAIEESSKAAIGHGQISIRDKGKKIASIGSVLVFQKYRGLGYSATLMNSLMSYGFSELGMNELRLGVFDFNLPAIKCYTNVGFTQSSFESKAIEIDGEKWDLIKMNKLKHEYSCPI